MRHHHHNLEQYHHPLSPGTDTIPHIFKLGPTAALYLISQNGQLRCDPLRLPAVDTIYAQAISKKAGKKVTPTAKRQGGGNNKVVKVRNVRTLVSFVTQLSSMQADWKEGFKKKQVGVSDMTLLTTITNEAVNENLSKRWKNGEIYTFIGGVLISVNPFRGALSA